MNSLWSSAILRTVRLCWPGIVEPSRVAGRRGLSGFREGMWLDNISFILEARNQSQSRHSAPQFFICVLHLSFGAIVGRSPLASTRPPTLAECDEPRGQRHAGSACGLSRGDTTYLTLPTTCSTSVIISMNLDYSVYVNIVFSVTQNVSQSWMSNNQWQRDRFYNQRL